MYVQHNIVACSDLCSLKRRLPFYSIYW